MKAKKKCQKCNRTKALRLFSKNQTWCKSCFKKWRQNRIVNLKNEDFFDYKAIQFRNNWRRRAKSAGVDPDVVPSRVEIKEWLESQYPFKCFFTGVDLDRNFGVDHYVSIIRGGSFGFDNLVITSQEINGAKGSMTGDEFKSLLNTIRNWEDGGQEILQRLRASNGWKRKGK